MANEKQTDLSQILKGGVVKGVEGWSTNEIELFMMALLQLNILTAKDRFQSSNRFLGHVFYYS